MQCHPGWSGGLTLGGVEDPWNIPQIPLKYKYGRIFWRKMGSLRVCLGMFFFKNGMLELS